MDISLSTRDSKAHMHCVTNIQTSTGASIIQSMDDTVRGPEGFWDWDEPDRPKCAQKSGTARETVRALSHPSMEIPAIFVTNCPKLTNCPALTNCHATCRHDDEVLKGEFLSQRELFSSEKRSLEISISLRSLIFIHEIFTGLLINIHTKSASFVMPKSVL